MPLTLVAFRGFVAAPVLAGNAAPVVGEGTLDGKPVMPGGGPVIPAGGVKPGGGPVMPAGGVKPGGGPCGAILLQGYRNRSVSVSRQTE